MRRDVFVAVSDARFVTHRMFHHSSSVSHSRFTVLPSISTRRSPADGLLSRDDLSRMFLSSSMLALDRTMSDVATAFVSQIFEMLKVEPHGKISAEHIEEFQHANPGRFEDVWELIGRSMLKDFGGSKRSAASK